MGYSPWGHKKSATIERLTFSYGIHSNKGVFKVWRRLLLIQKRELGRDLLISYCIFSKLPIPLWVFPVVEAKNLGIIYNRNLDITGLHENRAHRNGSEETLHQSRQLWGHLLFILPSKQFPLLVIAPDFLLKDTSSSLSGLGVWMVFILPSAIKSAMQLSCSQSEYLISLALIMDPRVRHATPGQSSERLLFKLLLQRSGHGALSL